MKSAIVLGAGGFIGSHMVARLKRDGYYVVGVDLKENEFEKSLANEFIIGDLRHYDLCKDVLQDKDFDVVIQTAADMGGALWVFTGENDAEIIHNSATINLNVCEVLKRSKAKIFFSSSACAYSEKLQLNANNTGLKEKSAWEGRPDSVYGIEKLFSEEVYNSYRRNYGLDVRIARFHNIFGENGTYGGDRAKAPAALARKVSAANDGASIEVFGDGLQTRSFLYIDECVEGVMRLLDSNYKLPINIGSEEMISINDLAKLIIKISGKNLTINNVPSNALGVRGRNSDNELCRQILKWSPTQPLVNGMKNTYDWINKRMNGIV